MLNITLILAQVLYLFSFIVSFLFMILLYSSFKRQDKYLKVYFQLFVLGIIGAMFLYIGAFHQVDTSDFLIYFKTGYIILLVSRLIYLYSLYSWVDGETSNFTKSYLIILMVLGILFIGIIQDVKIILIIFVSIILVIHVSIIFKYLSKYKRRWLNNLIVLNLLIIVLNIYRLVTLLVDNINQESYMSHNQNTLSIVLISIIPYMILVSAYHLNFDQIVKGYIEQFKEKEYFEKLFQASPFGIMVGTFAGEIIDFNEGYARLSGRKKEDIQGHHWTEFLYDKNDVNKIISAIEKINSGENYVIYESKILHLDGSVRIIEIYTRPHGTYKGANSYLAFCFDITERLSLSSEVKKMKITHENILQNIKGYTFVIKVDEYYTATHLSQGFENLLGHKVEDFVNNKSAYVNLLHPEDLIRTMKEVDETRNFVTGFDLEYRIRDINGNYIWITDTSVVVKDEDGNADYFEGICVDTTRRKKAEKQYEYAKTHDLITSLFNEEYLNELVQKNPFRGSKEVTVITIDIDGYKFIRDTFEYEYAKNIIIYLSDIIIKHVPKEAIIIRGAKYDFTILLEEQTYDQALSCFQSIQTEINQNISLEVELKLSCGISSSKNREINLEDLILEAETILIKEKRIKTPILRKESINTILHTLYEKDPISEIHSRDVATLSVLLAKKANLSSEQISNIEVAGLVHDIGKIIIPSEILKSNGSLSAEEYTEIKKHPEIGYRILQSVKSLIPISNIVLCHHERIDGTGYPNGIKGEQIPIESKIISICDAFDAMTSLRHYRDSKGYEYAIKEIMENTGTQFDETLSKLFVDKIIPNLDESKVD